MSRILPVKPTNLNTRFASWQKRREVCAGVRFYVAKDAAAAEEARAKYRLQKILAENSSKNTTIRDSLRQASTVRD
jgi:hypothetical protein